MLLKKLRRRFIIINMSLVTIVIAAILASSILSTANELKNSSYTRLNNDMRQYDEYEPEFDTRDNFKKIRSPISTFWITLDNNMNLVKIDNQPTTVTSDELESALDALLAASDEQGTISSLDLRYATYKMPSGNTLIGFIDISYDQDFLYSQIMTFVIIGLSSLLVFFVISYYLSRLIVHPVETAFKQQRQFVSDASHELKTPLSVILANTSIILSNPEKDTVKWTSYIDTEAKRMKKLVEDLLFLARIDEEGNKILFKKTNLSDMVWESVLPFEPVAFEKGLDMDYDISSDIFVNGNDSNLKKLVYILVDNACKYCVENGTIKLVLKKSNNKARLEVNNPSQSISPAELDNIFDRFYRVDKARDRKQGSYGLGLSIAQRIVQAHKGQISADNNEEDGTTFTVELPLSADQ